MRLHSIKFNCDISQLDGMDKYNLSQELRFLAMQNKCFFHCVQRGDVTKYIAYYVK